jgi:hypothetical protein
MSGRAGGRIQEGNPCPARRSESHHLQQEAAAAEAVAVAAASELSSTHINNSQRTNRSKQQ